MHQFIVFHHPYLQFTEVSQYFESISTFVPTMEANLFQDVARKAEWHCYKLFAEHILTLNFGPDTMNYGERVSNLWCQYIEEMRICAAARTSWLATWSSVAQDMFLQQEWSPADASTEPHLVEDVNFWNFSTLGSATTPPQSDRESMTISETRTDTESLLQSSRGSSESALFAYMDTENSVTATSITSPTLSTSLPAESSSRTVQLPETLDVNGTSLAVDQCQLTPAQSHSLPSDTQAHSSVTQHSSLRRRGPRARKIRTTCVCVDVCTCPGVVKKPRRRPAAWQVRQELGESPIEPPNAANPSESEAHEMLLCSIHGIQYENLPWNSVRLFHELGEDRGSDDKIARARDFVRRIGDGPSLANLRNIISEGKKYRARLAAKDPEVMTIAQRYNRIMSRELTMLFQVVQQWYDHLRIYQDARAQLSKHSDSFFQVETPECHRDRTLPATGNPRHLSVSKITDYLMESLQIPNDALGQSDASQRRRVSTLRKLACRLAQFSDKFGDGSLGLALAVNPRESNALSWKDYM